MGYDEHIREYFVAEAAAAQIPVQGLWNRIQAAPALRVKRFRFRRGLEIGVAVASMVAIVIVGGFAREAFRRHQAGSDAVHVHPGAKDFGMVPLIMGGVPDGTFLQWRNGQLYGWRGTENIGTQIIRLNEKTGIFDRIADISLQRKENNPGVLSPDGTHFYYQGYLADQPSVVDVDLRTGKERAIAPLNKAWTESISISPDGKYLSFGSEKPGTNGMKYSSILEIVQLDGSLVRSLESGYLFRQLGWVNDRLYWKSHEGINVFDLKEDRNELVVKQTNIVDVDLAPDGSQMVYTVTDGDEGAVDIFALDLPNGAPKKIAQHVFLQYRVAAAPGGRYGAYIAVQSGDQFKSEVWIYDRQLDKPRKVIESAPIFALKWSPNGRQLLWMGVNDAHRGGHESDVIHLTDAATGEDKSFSPLQSRKYTEAVWSPDGRRLAVIYVEGGKPGLGMVELAP